MERGYRLLRSFRLTDNPQIGVALDYRNDTFSDDWMIIDAQNCNGVISEQGQLLAVMRQSGPYHTTRVVGFAGMHKPLLTALKRLALPAELLAARPKRLRFLIFHTSGKMIRHARRQILRLARAWKRFGNWQGALRLLPPPT
jgi:hypothetical protein